ncbi:hypothetical protein F3Y22_tig00116989pilonHSYRG00686 [Hibiscus syriacus]|uniref:RNase H type-1 domain-containing protein n=1 Tax=Hibiscus syriacus TaxID=106335 RepID=A0A6A2WFY6_HIBSY|nr:hypothetical protein F3Y22_tig00116989pilonHSYRG00686 [Hibiscus syriacus]
MAFIDIEKAYDSVPRDTIWKTLEKRQIPTAYSRAIRDMYFRSTTYVRTTVGDTEAFPDGVPWCMLFADDIVLAVETRTELNMGTKIMKIKRHRIMAGWLKWRAATGVLCDKKDVLGVVPVSEKLREGRLRWFGHVLRRQSSDAVRRVESITVDGARRRGRPRRKWEDCLRSDLNDLALTEDMTTDRKRSSTEAALNLALGQPTTLPPPYPIAYGNRLMADENPEMKRSKNGRSDYRWCKATRGGVKVNADGVLGGSPRMDAVGGVLRDDQGKWIFSFDRSLGICTALMAELWVIHDSLVHAWNLRFRKIDLENDCTRAVDML